MNQNYNTSQIINDLPAEEDYLGFDSYVHAFKELILDPNTRSPLTLGIFGRWGTGKTTLMKMLQKRLEDSGMSDDASRSTQKKTATVWFDAWRYDQEENLWAAFLQSILNQVDRDWRFFKKVRFRINLLRNRIDQHRLEEVLVKNLWRVFVAVLPLVLSWQIAIRIRQDILSALTWLAGGLLTIIAGAWGVILPLINAIKDNIDINLNDFMKASNYESHIAFLDQFHDHFEDIVESIPDDKAVQTPTRLVIFIDDLDRCSAEKMIQALDAIKLFADVPGCIYIIGLDHAVVYGALKVKYKDDETASSEYLEKIIQLPFYLPAFEDDDMGEYIQKLKFQLPTERCDRLFSAGLVANPRLVKRTINAFSFLWRLACSKPELSKAITPVRLAKIVVIQQRHPDLYNIVKENPGELIELEQFFQARNNILTLGGPDGQNEPQEYFPKYLEAFYSRIESAFSKAALDLLYRELGLPSDNNEIEVKRKKLIFFVEKNKLYKEFLAACVKMGYKNFTEEVFSGIAQSRTDELENEKKKLRQELQRFIDIPQLSRLMLFNELAKDSTMDDTSFAGLSNEAIQRYFTLTLTTDVPALSSPPLENQPAPKAEGNAALKKNESVR